MKVSSFLKEQEYSMGESAIKQAMAESGKMTQKQLLDYMKAKHDGKYDPKLAKECAKEIVSSM